MIVSLNAEMIWHQPDRDQGRATATRVSDHAVVVTGVDTANGVVHLNDSGNPEGRDEQIPMALFVKAWATERTTSWCVTTGQPGARSVDEPQADSRSTRNDHLGGPGISLGTPDMRTQVLTESRTWYHNEFLAHRTPRRTRKGW